MISTVLKLEQALLKSGTRHLSRKSLSFTEFGSPLSVLHLVDDELDVENLGSEEVLLKVLMSAINPADLSMIKGKYPVRPRFPAIPGSDFVAEVVQLGELVRDLSVGQRVVALEPFLGSWTTHMIVHSEQVYPISDALDLMPASMVTMNPCAAYRMLQDFVKIRPGDLVIQNAANGCVGQCVHQLCKLSGVKSLGIIRDRPDAVLLKQKLMRLGATEVLTEQEFEETDIFNERLPKPILALNCVGGKSAEMISRHLDHNGVMVTYSNLSQKPFRAFTGPLIFKQNKCVGFWMTQWNYQNSRSSEQLKMIDNQCQRLIYKNLVLPPLEPVPMEEFKSAKEAFTPDVSIGKKFVLDMTHLQGKKNKDNKEDTDEVKL